MKTTRHNSAENQQNADAVTLTQIKETYRTPRLVAHGQLERVTLQSSSCAPGDTTCAFGEL